jgi:hypothetical protein
MRVEGAMANVARYWNDAWDNSDTPSDGSAGLPSPSSDGAIDQGGPGITASFGTVNPISIGSSGPLAFTDAGANSVTGGAAVMAASTDTWTYEGTANWDTPGDWSAGVPTTSSDVVIDEGSPEVTASFATVASISIGGPAWTGPELLFTDAGASSVTGDVTNSGDLYLDRANGDGGSSLTIGGALTNGGNIEIGPTVYDWTLSAASTITATSLTNFSGASLGTIELDGSSEVEATLDVESAAGFGAAGVLYGSVLLGNNTQYGSKALIEFASGQITTIAAGSSLVLAGPHAFVADASDTSSNSALTGLTTIDGELDLYNGASLTTSGALTNSGTINLLGSEEQGTDTLNVGSAAGLGAAGMLYGDVNLNGDAVLEFASGQITTIAAGAELSLMSSGAFVADASSTGSNSALTGLTTVDGGLVLDGGVKVATSSALTNSGTITLDPNFQGSSLTIGGTLTNDGTIEIGNSHLFYYPSTVEATSLTNLIGSTYGAIDLTGSSNAAILGVGSAAGFGSAGVLYGDVNLSGDARIEFGHGQITTISANSELSLTSAGSVVADASNTTWNSALRGLATVAGGLYLHDGATVTTSGDVTNDGVIALDQNKGDGGSWLNVHGTLTNAGTIDIGNGALSARSAVWALSVVNTGTIDVHGVGDCAVTNIHATLKSTGAFMNDGSVNFADDYDKISGAVSGRGSFSLADGATVELGGAVSSGETFKFDGGDKNRLILDQASSFHGTIDDFFTKGDAVRARTFAEATTLLSYTQTGADSCSWTLTDGAQTAVLNFAGEPYAQSDFKIVSANGGMGLAIKFV